MPTTFYPPLPLPPPRYHEPTSATTTINHPSLPPRKPSTTMPTTFYPPLPLPPPRYHEPTLATTAINHPSLPPRKPSTTMNSKYRETHPTHDQIHHHTHASCNQNHNNPWPCWSCHKKIPRKTPPQPWERNWRTEGHPMAACLESQAHAFVGACFGQQRCQKNEGDESESKSEKGGDKKTKMRKERVEKEKETISA